MPKQVEKVAEYFILDEKKFSYGGICLLTKELQEKFPRCYIQGCAGESGARAKLSEMLAEKTVSEIVSFTRHDVSVKSYLARYYHLRFVPVDGYWIL